MNGTAGARYCPRGRRRWWARRAISFITSTLCLAPLPTLGDAGNFLRRLRWLRDPHEVAQDRRGALEARLRLLPVVEEHDLHVRPHAGVGAFVADVGDQAFGVGEGIVAEGDHRALWSSVDLLHIGAAREGLDRNDLQQVIDLARQRAEAIRKLGAKRFDLVLVLDLG